MAEGNCDAAGNSGQTPGFPAFPLLIARRLCLSLDETGLLWPVVTSIFWKPDGVGTTETAVEVLVVVVESVSVLVVVV